MEYVIAYARQTWKCPVIFYTGTRFDNENYGDMVAALLRLQQKWDIGVIDMWNNAELNNIPPELYDLYMQDDIHPTRAGYREWWLPVIENYLIEYLCSP